MIALVKWILNCLAYYQFPPNEPYLDQNKWRKYLGDNLALDSSFKSDLPIGTYTVFIKFSIDESGLIGNVSSVNDVGFGLADWVVNRFNKFKNKMVSSKLGRKYR